MAEHQKIQHLYSRAGFGLNPKEWAEKKTWPLGKAVDELFRNAKKKTDQRSTAAVITTGLPDRNDKEAIRERRKQERRMVMLQNTDWVKRMSDPSESCLLEKMTLFWHGHFACTTRNSKLAAAQLATLRRHALGSFRDFVKAIARDVSMIRFLNNQQNRKQQPNENFARELMELFTIGRGRYSEQDIKEAARAFTGWSSNLKGEYVFRPFQHDYGRKTFMGKQGKFDGDEIIDIILEQREAARFIAAKVYRFFVSEKEDAGAVEELAGVFYDSGYDISRMMRHLFKSDWFYHPRNVGVRIKSPVELLAGLLRTLEVEMKEPLSLLFVQRALGQVLFDPPNVAGWPGGRSWIDNSTLMLRLNLVHFLFRAADIQFRVKEAPEMERLRKGLRDLKAEVNMQPFRQHFDTGSTEAFLGELTAFLLPANARPDTGLISRFVRGRNEEEKIQTALACVMALPEYQLC